MHIIEGRKPVQVGMVNWMGTVWLPLKIRFQMKEIKK